MKPINRTTRQKVEEYRGFLIIRNIWEHSRGHYHVERNVSYSLCKPDETTEKAWNKAYNRLDTWGRTVESIKKVADSILSGERVVYTDEQYQRFVKGYNNKYNFGFNRNRLLATMRTHKNGDKVMKRLMEDRLEDANFHDYCAALCENDYEKFMDLLNVEFSC